MLKYVCKVITLLSFLTCSLLYFFSENLFAQESPSLTKWEYKPGKYTYKYAKPLDDHLLEWRDSFIPDSLTFLNLISLPDIVEQRKGRSYYPILDILGWEYYDSFPVLEDRTAWSYYAYEVSSLKPSEQYEVKPNPYYELKGGSFKRYYSTSEDPMIWLPKVSYDVSAKIFNKDLKRIFFNKAQSSFSLISRNIIIEDKSFWADVKKSNMPIIFTEGLKKSLAVLATGNIAVSIPGACRGVNPNVSASGFELISDVKELISNKRKVYIHFDNDQADYLKRVVFGMVLVLSELIRKEGNEVGIIITSDDTKGADDYIKKYGRESYLELISKAYTIEQFKNQGHELLSPLELSKVNWCIVPCQSKCLYDKHKALDLGK